MPGAYASCQISKPALVDAHRVAHRDQLGVALDGAREVELDVERDEIEAFERLVVSHGHDVVEPVNPDSLPAGSAGVVGDVLTRASMEHLLERCRAVLADVPCLGGEDDERLTVGRDDHVGVPMDDLEPGHVRDGALEPAVLAARDDQDVEPVFCHCCTHVRVTSFELCA